MTDPDPHQDEHSDPVPSRNVTDLISVAAGQVGGKALHLLAALGEYFGVTVSCHHEVSPTLHRNVGTVGRPLQLRSLAFLHTGV